MAEVKIQKDWKALLQDEFNQPYFEELIAFVKSEYKNHTVYPPAKQIFSAFDFVPPQDVKVVILGQDPYHGSGQAHGLCFSVPDGIPTPKSLINIFKEIESDLGTPTPPNGNLERWAEQGVFLLNASLTVRVGEAASHQNCGWMTFTDAVIKSISENCNNVVFLLWGNFAKNKAALIDTSKHLILTAAHPSPLAAYRGFFGCKHFSKTNEYLKEQGKEVIEW